MSADTETNTETNTEVVEQEPEQVEQPDDTDENGNREAAKWRRRLRETEAERDQLRGQVQALQRAEAERIAGETVRAPAALWAAGVDVADLLDDTGAIDPAKVRDAVQAAAEQLGLARSPRPDPTQGQPLQHGDRKPTFAAAFAPRP